MMGGTREENRETGPQVRPREEGEGRGAPPEPDAAFYLCLLGEPPCKADGSCSGCGQCGR